MAGMAATYISASSFKVSGDYSAQFNQGRRIKCNCGVDGLKYGTVESSSYNGDDVETTIVLEEDSDDLTANLSEAWYGIVQPGDEGSVPVHSHTRTQGSGGGISHLHRQQEAATVWIVNHNLGSLFVHVDTIVGGKSVAGTYDEPEIEYVTINQLKLTWTEATSGHCVCIGGYPVTTTETTTTTTTA